MEKNNPSGNKLSDLFYNWITYTGVICTITTFVVESILFGFDFFTGSKNLYLGIFTYFLFPVCLISSLLLIPIGALWKKKRLEKGLATAKPKPFYVDLAIPAHRHAAMIFIAGTSVFMIMTTIGSYKAFHYVESPHFCGLLCHQVMNPQYTAYQDSAHARVKCVECHIGSGAQWYVRSKIAGLRQIYKLATKTYQKPIPTPVHDLRPASETCEQCHWPGKFYSSMEIRRTYFPSEKGELPPWQLRMMVNIGRGLNKNYGIHAHMYLDNEIFYAADDAKRQSISWVKSRDKEGKEIIFTTASSKYKGKEPPAEKIRKMDCVDCHNQPTHHFQAPYRLVDQALFEGRIKSDIPSIKMKTVEILSREYPSTEEAAKAIESGLTVFYEKKYPDFYASRAPDVKQAAAEAVSIFKKNIFPEMNVRWDKYPDNIGHLISPGCFRCHDGEHKAPNGQVISRECNVCHTIIEQGPLQTLEKSTDGVAFRHPFNEDESWKEMNCFDCHTGGTM